MRKSDTQRTDALLPIGYWNNPELPTPETEAACHGFIQANPQKTDVDMWGIQCVDAAFARSLERRLAAAVMALERVLVITNDICRAEHENRNSYYSAGEIGDIARETIDTIKEKRMKAEPDKLTADLRQHEREQDEAERDYLSMLPELRAEAARAVRDAKRLKLILEDEALAVPLATIVTELDAAFDEFAYATFPQGSTALEDVLLSCNRIEHQLVNWMNDYLQAK